MKVAVWSGLGRIGPYVTGVGKHIVNLSRGLEAHEGFDVRLVLSAEHWANDVACSDESPLAHIPGLRLPLKRRHAEALWQSVRAPAIDRWCEGADWVYCPKECYAPVRRARYAVTVHDLYGLEGWPDGNSVLRRVHKRRVLQHALDEATLVLAVSDFTKGRIVELLGIPADKIRVVGNGVDADFFRAPKRRTLSELAPQDQRYLLAVGGLTRKKGAPTLLQLATVLSETAPEIEIVVIGPIEPEFEAALKRLPNIRHLERGIPDSQMHDLVRRATASLVLSEYEGFGIPALEAMAAEVPVVAARRAALPEVVGDAAVLVDSADARAVSDAVLAIMQDNDTRRGNIAKGLRRAREFTWDACVARVAVALEEFSERRPNETS